MLERRSNTYSLKFLTAFQQKAVLGYMFEIVDNVDNVDNIDVFLVAPGDLGQSMGLHDRSDPKVIATIDKAIDQIIGSGKIAGTLVDSTNVESYIVTAWSIDFSTPPFTESWMS